MESNLKIPLELWLEQMKFLLGHEIYRCKLISKKWKLLIEKCEAILPIAPTFPSHLNPDDAAQTVEVSVDRLSVTFRGFSDADYYAGCVRANCSIPRCLGIYYFEMRIINGGLNNYIGIGLAKKCVSLNGLPGWRRGAIGYHGDDGKLYDSRGIGERYGPKFTTNDVIGCGIDYVNNRIFYTKNGTAIGKVVFHKKLYPLFGLNSPEECLEVNFGQDPFVYDIQKDIWEIRKLLKPIDTCDDDSSSDSLYGPGSDDDELSLDWTTDSTQSSDTDTSDSESISSDSDYLPPDNEIEDVEDVEEM